MKRWKKIFDAKSIQKQLEWLIQISGKIDFKIKIVSRQRTLYDYKKVNPFRRYNNYKYICTLATRSQYIGRKTELKGEIDNSTLIAGDLSTHFNNG